MKHLYDFGMSQEDAKTEFRALDIKDGDRLLVICGAGEMPLNLLAMADVDIVAADISIHQIRLAKLKLAAALTLDGISAARFLGYKAAAARFRREMWPRVKERLDDKTAAFWVRHAGVLENGAIGQGRFEKFLSKVNGFGLFVLGKKRVIGLFENSAIEEQRDYFDRRIDTARLKLIFKIAFSKKVYGRKGLDPQALIHSEQTDMAAQFFGRFRDFCTSNHARSNYFLQYTLFNDLLFDDALPEFLSAEGLERVRANHGKLRFFHGDITEALSAEGGEAFSKFQLSNLSDWLEEKEHARLLFLLSEKAPPGAKIVSRFIHREHPLPPEISARFDIDRELGMELLASDRYPFYTIVPMTFTG